ncbi:MAG: hydratase [Treponema sp.]|jgi:aconitate hydratase|nr:hydratase [Treponema sp.]
MVKVIHNGVYLINGNDMVEDIPEHRETIQRLSQSAPKPPREGTMAYRILRSHNTAGDDHRLALRFDAMVSHDITFVNIVQTAKVSGLEKFPIPYILTNCHNSLCAVGGTINEDDHRFGLSAAQKYGGVYVPPHLAVIHSYIRDTQAGCGKMILGSDSHTRYGALGTMGVGEGGGELVKQLLGQPYDIPYPKVIGVYLRGKPGNGVGPQDVALAIIGAVFKDGLVKNNVLEFVGDGIAALPADFRAGIDVMTTETTCWSSIWETDAVIRDYLVVHGRGGDYQRLSPEALAYYDGMILVDLSAVKPMIALPFHPSNVYTIDTLNSNLGDILRKVEQEAAEIIEYPGIHLKLTDKIDDTGRLRIDQGIIAGCAGGTFDNIMAASTILQGGSTGNISLSVYPGSQPVMLELAKNGALSSLIASGAIIRTAFCGPCFGAGDVPANNGLSIRHTTRNFPNREGSKPAEGQISSVALMDARSIAATVRNGGYLTSAETLAMETEAQFPYHYDDAPYRNRVYNGIGKPEPEAVLQYGPNITDWPPMEALGEHLLVKIVSFITDPVTTTDEIIPSGETSSFRSNPVGLAEYTLSRKDPDYVGRAKAVHRAEAARLSGAALAGEAAVPESRGPIQILPELEGVFARIRTIKGMENIEVRQIQIGSALYARKPGDGSAREQAASCQRVLGGCANFAQEYATKRYRSNLINWGILPFVLNGTPPFKNRDYVFIPHIVPSLMGEFPALTAYSISEEGILPFSLGVPELTPLEKAIIRDGCLINYNRFKMSSIR